ncbi:type II secretion system F family protein [Hyperthermus butylicus]|uniref:type II secretion system F family protein n=1 Tax=Hyperthermus butylicus TaxID=54248 RepID=UPI001E366C96|nr:type II secretion system F family protein [Hyperthermus butylicus]
MEAFAALGEKLDPLLRYHVVGSGIASSFERYVVLFLAATVAVVFLAGILPAVMLYIQGFPAIIAAVFGAGGALIAFIVMLAIYIALPMLAARNRGQKLEARFLLFAQALATRLLAGAGLIETFERMYREDLRELKEFSIELEYIVSGIRAGIPVDRVLEEASKLTPSPSLHSLLAGLSAAARTGSGLREVVDAAISEYLSTQETEIDRLTNSLGALLEFYMAAAVMLPVSIGVVGLLLVFQQVAGLSFDAILFLTTFIGIPVTVAVVVIMADMIVSRLRI